MKNLTCFPEDSFRMFTQAVGRKTDAVSQAKLIAAYPTINPRYDLYDQAFVDNSLEELIYDPVHDPIRLDLEGLYSSNSTVVNDIRLRLEELQPRAIRYVCPYCTVDSPNTMDHVIPKSEFPEFAIHPKNLIPSCSSCNQYKGVVWRIGDEKTLINFYTDRLPNDRYLEVFVFADADGLIDFSYRLRYIPGMNYNMFKLITSHYNKLRLRERMRKSAIRHLTEFQHSIRPRYHAGESRATLTQTVLEACADDRREMGVNHWKPAMHEALVNSDLFWNTL